MKRAYSTRWSEEMNKKFIEARIELEPVFTRKTCILRECWEQVGERCGAQEPWEQLRKRWNNLLDKYKRIREPPTGNGTEGVDIATTWPYYDMLHSYCSQRHTFVPVMVINSEASTSRAAEEQRTAQLRTAEGRDSGSRVSESHDGEARRVPSRSSTSRDSDSRSSGARSSATPDTPGVSPRLTRLEKSALKTNKQLRKTAKALERLLEERYNITVDSSESDSD